MNQHQVVTDGDVMRLMLVELTAIREHLDRASKIESDPLRREVDRLRSQRISDRQIARMIGIVDTDGQPAPDAMRDRLESSRLAADNGSQSLLDAPGDA